MKLLILSFFVSSLAYANGEVNPFTGLSAYDQHIRAEVGIIPPSGNYVQLSEHNWAPELPRETAARERAANARNAERLNGRSSVGSQPVATAISTDSPEYKRYKANYADYLRERTRANAFTQLDPKTNALLPHLGAYRFTRESLAAQEVLMEEQRADFKARMDRVAKGRAVRKGSSGKIHSSLMKGLSFFGVLAAIAGKSGADAQTGTQLEADSSNHNSSVLKDQKTAYQPTARNIERHGSESFAKGER